MQRIGFADGAQAIYDSKSKWDDYYDDLSTTNYNRLNKTLFPICHSVA
jgi:hypothetical protein